jgi:hypothetical protein
VNRLLLTVEQYLKEELLMLVNNAVSIIDRPRLNLELILMDNVLAIVVNAPLIWPVTDSGYKK